MQTHAYLPADIWLPPRVQTRHDWLDKERAPSTRVEQGREQTREGRRGDGAVTLLETLEGHLRGQVLHHRQGVRPQSRESAE